MDREELDNWCEKGVLGLVLAILAFSVLAIGAARPQDFVIVQWMAVVLLAIWSFRFLINPKHRLLWTPVCWPVLAFVAYAIIRYRTADVEYLARQELVRVVVYAVIFFAVINNLHKQEPSQIVGLTLIFLAMALSFYAVLQFLRDWDEVWTLVGSFEKSAGNRKRGSGTFVNPNHLAGYLELVLPLALAFTLTGRFSHLMKIVLGYASVVIFAGLIVTFSRGGWIGAAASLAALFYWTVRQREYWKRTLIVLGVFAALFTVTFTKARMSANRYERFEETRQLDDIRFRLWEPAKAMWRDHLWFGVGPNHFDARFGQYRPFDYDLQVRPDRAHNDYLNTVADWGLVGGLLVAACWGTFFWQVFTGWRFVQRSQSDLGAKRSNRASFVLGGALGLVAILVHSYWDFNMHIPANAILAVTIMALVASYYRFASERYWHTVRLPLKIVVYPVLAVALVWLGMQSWRRTRECVRLAHVETINKAIARESAKAADPGRLAVLGREQIAAMKAVLAAEPKNFEAAIELGEALRMQSFVGLTGYESLAQEALDWFRKAMELNAYEARPRIGYGMCLDWLERHEEAGRYFEEARRLDGNQFLVAARIGWHFFQIEDYSLAKQWFETSLRLASDSRINSNAWTYLRLTEQKLAESTNSPFHKRVP